MITNKKIANALSGKTARPCDCCIRKRARWYCPADDAFLCQSCDGSVHSANSLAQRHERIRLKTASLKPFKDDLPSWHRGLTRKPRTPRGHGKHQLKSEDQILLNVTVPELSMEDIASSQDSETEEKLLYRVPIFDPFVIEGGSDLGAFNNSKSSHPNEYMTSDLEEFAADVETLLGKGLDDESYGIGELGLLDCSSSIMNDNTNENSIDKLVKEEVDLLGGERDMICRKIEDVIQEPFDLTFDYDEDDHKEIVMIEQSSLANELCKLETDNGRENEEWPRKIFLSLDYEAVSSAWASHGCPWMNGQRPEINPPDYWPHWMGTGRPEIRHSLYGENQMGGVGDGGREARVLRYREKRRTRLFSKKIRYEVRKLNAEKRPRMKGRFVKRTSFVAVNASFPILSNN